MNAKCLSVGTIVGAVTIFATGTALFRLPVFADFYTYAIASGSATGVLRAAPLFWAVALGSVSYAALVTLAVMYGPGSTNVVAGVKTGAVVGLLLWLSSNMMLLGVTNVGDATTALLNPLVELIPGALAGGAIALAVGRLRRPTTARNVRAAA